MKFLHWEVLLKFVATFQFRLKSDNNDGHLTLRPTCVSGRGSDWVGNPQSVLVAMVVLGIPAVTHPRIHVITTPSQTDARQL
jgi:hypothetical protein